ncbi:MAG: EF-P lysine aminoacylase GenX [Pirellulaceae bacterium]|nr:EF-P lysine aminoacylase GenX [Pirellulaceae bacterium]
MSELQYRDDPLDDWHPTAHRSSLQQRAKIINSIRQFFDAKGFLEVETPILSSDTVVDRYLDPFVLAADSWENPVYLQTSPEFGMKRLLAAGYGNIYQITRAFRRDEMGPHHNPEFSILEWYEVDADYDRGLALLTEFASVMFPKFTISKISFADAFEKYAGINPWTATAEELRSKAAQITPSESVELHSYDTDNLLNLILAHKVQPQLGAHGPEIVFDWPESQAALAKTRQLDAQTRVAERYELYAFGQELANGYHELLDAEELAQRQNKNNRLRELDGKPTLPENNRLIKAMRTGMPSCCGVAVGVDRLVMAVLGLKQIQDVIPFPFDRA